MPHLTRTHKRINPNNIRHHQFYWIGNTALDINHSYNIILYQNGDLINGDSLIIIQIRDTLYRTLLNTHSKYISLIAAAQLQNGVVSTPLSSASNTS